MHIFVRGLAVIAALITLVQHRPAEAEDYPSRPVTLIAPWPAGGAVGRHALPHLRSETDRQAWQERHRR